MRHLLFSLLVLIVCTSAGAQTDLQIRAAEIVGYGIFEAKTERRSRGFRISAPAADSVTGISFVKYTNDIPGELGTGFGFQYVINTSPRGGEMQVTNVIKFPGEGLTTPRGRVYKESREERTIKIGRRDFYGYAFDEEWEIAPGTWIFEVWHKEARIIRKTFNVIPAEQAEDES